MWLVVLQARQAVLFIACAAFYERRLVKHLAQHTMQLMRSSYMQSDMHARGTDAKQPNQHGIEQKDIL
jgi:hypothetical protein